VTRDGRQYWAVPLDRRLVEMSGRWLGTHPAFAPLPKWAMLELLAAYELQLEEIAADAAAR